MSTRLQVLRVRVLPVRTVLFARTHKRATSVALACPVTLACSATLNLAHDNARKAPAEMAVFAGPSATATTSASAHPAGRAKTAKRISTSASRIRAKTAAFASMASTITHANAIRLGETFLQFLNKDFFYC